MAFEKGTRIWNFLNRFYFFSSKVFFFAFLVLLIFPLSSAIWANDSFQNKVQINISGVIPQNYSLIISMTKPIDMQSDCDDFLIYNNSETGKLGYWTRGCNLTGLDFFVKIHDNRSIWLYYNCPTCQNESRMRDAFLIGDDFNDYTNLSTPYNMTIINDVASLKVIDGILNIQAPSGVGSGDYGWVLSNHTFLFMNYTIFTKAKTQANLVGIIAQCNKSFASRIAEIHDPTDKVGIKRTLGLETGHDYSLQKTFVNEITNKWYNISYTVNYSSPSNYNYTIYANDSRIYWEGDSNPVGTDTSTYIGFFSSLDPNKNMSIDYFYVTPKISPEPTYILGNEQVQASITTLLIAPPPNFVSEILSQNLICNSSAVNLNLTNATLYIWDSFGALIFSSTKNISGVINQSSWNYSNFAYIDYYSWNCQSKAINSSGGIYQDWGDSNQTLKFIINSTTLSNFAISKTPKLFDKNITLQVTAFSGSGTGIIFCNFSFSDPNGKMRFTNINGTRNGNVWTSQVSQNINLTGNWSYNVSCQNNYNQKQFLASYFNITDEVYFNPLSWSYTPDSGEYDKWLYFNATFFDNFDEEIVYNFTTNFNSSFQISTNQTITTDNLDNADSPKKNQVQIYFDSLIADGLYYGNITFQRLTADRKNFSIPLTIGINPPSATPRLMNVEETEECSITEGNCNVYKGGYAGSSWTVLQTVKNIGYYKATDCSLSFVNNQINLQTIPSSFNLSIGGSQTIALMINSSTTKSDYLQVFCKSATRLGYNTSNIIENRPFFNTIINIPTTSTGGGGGGGGLPEQVAVVSLAPTMKENYEKYNALTRAKAYAFFKTICIESLNKAGYKRIFDSRCIFSEAEIPEFLELFRKNYEVGIERTDFGILLDSYNQNQIENILVDKIDAEKYKLVYAEIITKKIPFTIKPKDIDNFFVILANPNPSTKIQVSPTEKLKSSRIITSSKDTWDVNVSVDGSTAEVTFEPLQKNKLSYIAESTITYQSVNDEVVMQTIQFRIINLRYFFGNLPSYLIGFTFVTIAIMLVYFFKKKYWKKEIKKLTG